VARSCTCLSSARLPFCVPCPGGCPGECTSSVRAVHIWCLSRCCRDFDGVGRAQTDTRVRKCYWKARAGIGRLVFSSGSRRQNGARGHCEFLRGTRYAEGSAAGRYRRGRGSASGQRRRVRARVCIRRTMHKLIFANASRRGFRRWCCGRVKRVLRTDAPLLPTLQAARVRNLLQSELRDLLDAPTALAACLRV
jgi:hypothetical protein